MKKVLFSALAVLSLSLTSCNKQDDPEQVVKEFMEAAKELDAEEMAKLMYGYADASKENRRKGIEAIQEKISSMSEREKEFLKNMTIDEVETTEEAKIKVKYNNSKETIRLCKENGKWVIENF